jgi:hypothetical protein
MDASPLALAVSPTPHTAQAVLLLRAGRGQVPRPGSICAALDAADPAAAAAAAYAEALAALDVGARVFGYDEAARIGAHDTDAAGVFDVAVYNLTGAPADVPAALEAFARAAGPMLAPTR